MHADEYSETSQTCKLEIFTKCEKGTPYMKDDTEQTMKLEQLYTAGSECDLNSWTHGNFDNIYILS